MAEQSINVPQVLVFLVVLFLASRWYLSKPPSSTQPRAAPSRTAPPINLAQVDQIAHMFPQLSRRDIAWDLQRNGGNATATTERVLSGRGLDTPDLITRYNLSSKIHAPEEPGQDEAPKKAWSADRNERQMNLQKRREDMILAARRKMEAQEKAKAAT
ncbi:hypothetical protein ACEQ8H_002883 [Pleosporales sp. CAS-2024a]